MSLEQHAVNINNERRWRFVRTNTDTAGEEIDRRKTLLSRTVYLAPCCTCAAVYSEAQAFSKSSQTVALSCEGGFAGVHDVWFGK